MTLLSILIAILLMIGAVTFSLSLRNRRELLKGFDKKEHKLYFLYPMADLILSKTPLIQYLHRKSQVREAGRAINVTNKPEVWLRLYWYSKISLFVMVLYLFLLMAFFSQLLSGADMMLSEGYLRRPNQGEGDQEVQLKVSLDAIEEDVPSDNRLSSYSEEITLHVEERNYKEEELEQLFEEAKDYLEIQVLGKNDNADRIYENLVFPRSIPGTGIAVDWKPEDPELIHRDGTINNESIGQNGRETMVTSILTCQEEVREHPMKFHIMPKEYSQEEQLKRKLKKEVEKSSENSRQEPWIKLPDSIEGYKIHWEEIKKDHSFLLVCMGILTAVLGWVYKDRQLEDQMKLRKNQMLIDYPEIINKFNLLITAGMTIKQAWYKIAGDYKLKKEEGCIKKRYAYEEMVLTMQELKLGMQEMMAYEAFGRRCGLLPYMKFSSLIAQNLRKGNRGLLELLHKEAVEAFEERKESAKRLGEEAGLKLLAPMIIMLIIVFIIILIPAFISFY